MWTMKEPDDFLCVRVRVRVRRRAVPAGRCSSSSSSSSGHTTVIQWRQCVQYTHTCTRGRVVALNRLKQEHLGTAKQGSWIWARRQQRTDTVSSMFSWVKQEQGGRNKDGEMYQTVTDGLQTLYTKKLLPLEETYLFHDFHSPALEAADFQSKPMVLLVGQYSTGKTTFIRYSLDLLL